MLKFGVAWCSTRITRTDTVNGDICRLNGTDPAHSLQVQNELLHNENDSLSKALTCCCGGSS
jgi:hypothetical protein